MLLLINGMPATMRTLTTSPLRPCLGHLVGMLDPASWMPRATGLPYAVLPYSYRSGRAAPSLPLLAFVREQPRRPLFMASPISSGPRQLTTAAFMRWHKEIRAVAPVAFPALPGTEAEPLPWDLFDALVMHGPPSWTTSPQVRQLAQEAKSRGKYLHVAIISSMEAVTYAADLHADSVSLPRDINTKASRVSAYATFVRAVSLASAAGLPLADPARPAGRSLDGPQ